MIRRNRSGDVGSTSATDRNNDHNPRRRGDDTHVGDGRLHISLGGVAVGLVLQHQFGMEPCAWCVVQRMFYVLVARKLVAPLTPVRRPERQVRPVAVGVPVAGRVTRDHRNP